jgi:hypothetical protein
MRGNDENTGHGVTLSLPNDNTLSLPNDNTLSSPNDNTLSSPNTFGVGCKFTRSRGARYSLALSSGCLVLSCLALWLSCPVLSCLVLSCLVLSCLVGLVFWAEEKVFCLVVVESCLSGCLPSLVLHTSVSRDTDRTWSLDLSGRAFVSGPKKKRGIYPRSTASRRSIFRSELSK